MVAALVAAPLLAFAGCAENDTAQADARATAQRYGELGQSGQILVGEVRTRLHLRNREGVSRVLPVLKDLPDVTDLSIWGVALTREDLQTIGKLNHLRTLSLEECEIDDADLAFLSDLRNVGDLRLHRNPVTDDGLRHLSAMKKLYRLHLGFTRVNGSGLKHISPELQRLTLSGTQLDDSTIDNCLRFQRINHLYFDNTTVTEAGLMKLVSLYWLDDIGLPDGISKDAFRTFDEAWLASMRAARAAGKEVPAVERRHIPL
jgi:hypothetical protein